MLCEPFTVSWQSKEPPGKQAWHDPACAFERTNILRAEENYGAPPVTAAQIEAVAFVATMAAETEMWVERALPANAMLFVNNHTIFHMRTALTGHPDPEPKRHLLRIFLNEHNGRPNNF